MNSVFVYGTLKSNGPVRGLDTVCGHSELIGEAVTQEAQYRMFNLGAFPAVMPGGEHDVVGELWQVHDDVMQDLDYIEGYPDFYKRRIVKTSLGDAWMYYIDTPSRSDLPEVKANTEGFLEWHND